MIPLFLCLILLIPVHGTNRGWGSAVASDTANSTWPPEGERIVCPVVRDTWVSSVGDEKTGSNGGAKRLKLKGNQEYSLLDFDLSALKGKIVTGALLHLRSATPDKAPLARIGVSTVAGPWVEGFSRWYWAQSGSACFLQAAYKKRDWAYPGSTLMDVVFGRGQTTWKFADCTAPDERGWQVCAVDTDVVAASAAGLSGGFCLYDEVGNIWSCKNDKFTYTYFPNRFFFQQGKWEKRTMAGGLDDRPGCDTPGTRDIRSNGYWGIAGGRSACSMGNPR